MSSTENYTPEANLEGNLQDDSYASQENEPVPVQGDKERVQDPMNEAFADSDEQLERDEDEAIDKSNIIDERTRGAKPQGSYQEPGDMEFAE